MKTNEDNQDHENFFCPDCKDNIKSPLVFDKKTTWGNIYNCETCYQPWIKAMPDRADVKIFPVAAALKNGTRFDKALVILALPMNLDTHLQNTKLSDIHFVDEIESVEKSEFALSIECRDAIYNAPAFYKCNPSYLTCDKGYIFRFDDWGNFVNFEQTGEYILRPFTGNDLNPHTEGNYPMFSTSIKHDIIIVGPLPSSNLNEN